MIETRTPESIHFEISYKLSKGATYIDALVEYAKEHNLEVETVAEIIKKSSVIKEKIRNEAAAMRLIKNDARHDITQLC
jgi:hypothetical protein